MAGASAMGCHTYNIWHALYSQLHKLINASIKQPDSVPLKKKSNSDIDGEDSGEEMDTTNDSDHDSEQIEIEFSSQTTVSGTRRSQRRTTAANKTGPSSSSNKSGIISKLVYKEFCQTLQSKMDVMLCIKDEDLLGSFSDLFLQCLHFTNVRNDLQVCVGPLQDALVKFATLSGNCLLIMHK